MWGTGSAKRDEPINKSVVAYPGPGAHTPSHNYTLKGDPRYGFGTNKRPGPVNLKSSIAPGPGGYEIESKAFDRKNPRFYVGQKLPTLKETTKVPGAGSYNPSPEKTRETLPSYSMKFKLGSSLGKGTLSPGPGAYESSLANKNSSAKFGFGTSKRPDVSPARKAFVPGPGQYKINVKVGEVPTYAMPNKAEEFKYV